MENAIYYIAKKEDISLIFLQKNFTKIEKVKVMQYVLYPAVIIFFLQFLFPSLTTYTVMLGSFAPFAILKEYTGGHKNMAGPWNPKSYKIMIHELCEVCLILWLYSLLA